MVTNLSYLRRFLPIYYLFTPVGFKSKLRPGGKLLISHWEISSEDFHCRAGHEAVAARGVVANREVAAHEVDEDIRILPKLPGEAACSDGSGRAGSAGEGLSGASFPDTEVDLGIRDDPDELRVHLLRKTRMRFEIRSI